MAHKKIGGFILKRLYLSFAIADDLWGFKRPDGKTNTVIAGLSIEGLEGYDSKVLVFMLFNICVNIGLVRSKENTA